MPTDEERIEAVRAMSPAELNVYVAMSLGAIIKTQEECNQSCQARLDLMQSEVEKTSKKAQDAQKNVAQLSGWMKGVWLIIGGMVAAGITTLLAWKK